MRRFRVIRGRRGRGRGVRRTVGRRFKRGRVRRMRRVAPRAIGFRL